MSALDIVLQRQVPVRSTGKAGAAAGAEAGSAPTDNAFASVLSGQSRGSADERDTVEAEADAASASDLPSGEQSASGEDALDAAPATRSDDILALLSGLISGAPVSAKPGPEASGDMELDAEAPDGEETALADMPEEEALSSLPVTARSPRQAQVTKTSPVADDEQKLAADGKPTAETGPRTAAPGQQMGSVPQNDVPAAAAVAQSMAGDRAGQSPQPAARPQPAAQQRDREKVSPEDKEVIRTLGLADEPSARPGDKTARADDRISGGAGRKSSARPADEQAAPRTGNVEVIESRRFVAPQAMSPNAQALTRSLVEAGESSLAAQRAAPAQTVAQGQSGQMLHTLKLQLNPVSLGSVTAVLKLTGEELSVSIQVETADAYRQLADDNQSILKAMRAQGYAVEQITIQHVPSGDRSGNPAQQQGFQGTYQGSGDAQSSDRGNDGAGAGRQGASQNGGQGRENNTYPGSGAGTGTGRSDGVYL